MNRIILIGNGFDLAHGLKTSYNDFINDLWTKEANLFCRRYDNNRVFEDDLIKITISGTYGIPSNLLPNPLTYDSFNKFLKESILRGNIEFKNKFFKTISQKDRFQNWLDIEEEYYTALKECLTSTDYKRTIQKLNSDFSAIKNALKEYLKEKITPQNEISEITNHIYSEFKPGDFTKEGISAFIQEEYEKITNEIRNYENSSDKDKVSFLMRSSARTSNLIEYFVENKHKEDYMKEMIQSINSPDFTKRKTYNEIKKLFDKETEVKDYFYLYPKEILFLNFNYTDTEREYTKHTVEKKERFNTYSIQIPTITIHIHGELNNPQNPIIFGYGDEMDAQYREIENRKDNDFLENAKSIQYLNTRNYKNLLNFIETEPYQILIFGHSCGCSDRTLLNILFEHKNCVSIKPYYYQIDESNNNYSETVKNISRHFNDKAALRDKVVNEKDCDPIIAYKSK
jgi:hypothetical protein